MTTENGWRWKQLGVAATLVGAMSLGCSSGETGVSDPTPAVAVPSPQGPQSNAVGPADEPGAADSNANITFEFTYVGTDPHWNDEAKEALNDAAESVAAYLVVPKPVTITYQVADDNEPNHLAQAASDRVDTETPGYFRTVVQQKLITGEDANGDEPDGDIDVNWTANWAYGDEVAAEDEDAGTANQDDFKATLMHELVHTLGFDTNVQGPGSPPVTNRPVFDSFIVNDDGTKVINDDYTWNTAFDANLTGGNGGLYFGGPNAMAAYDGKPVPLLTEKEWNVSNVAHLDGYTFTGADKKLMNPGDDDSGVGVRVLSPIELGILQDIGYTVTTTP